MYACVYTHIHTHTRVYLLGIIHKEILIGHLHKKNKINKNIIK